MITVIHGDNLKSSRQHLSELASRAKNPLKITVEALSMTSLTQALEGGSLFEESKTLILEDFLSKYKKGKEKEAMLAYLTKKSDTHMIILWEGKSLTKTSYNSFKNPQVVEFKLPQTLFAFLDELRPKNTPKIVSLHHQSLQTTEPELLFFMIVRHVRLLLSMLDQTSSSVDEVKRLAPWQQTKLRQQAKLFGKEKLLQLHSQLFDVEVKQKSGKLPADLVSSIDFLLMSL